MATRPVRRNFAPAPLVSLDPVETRQQYELSPMVRRAQRKKKQAAPVNEKISDVSREHFISELLAAVERMGGRQYVADALGVNVRYIFRWQKGDGPALNKAAELIDKLQTMERD